MTRPIIVQKYGGSSVATVEKLRQVADLVVARRREGFDLVVVVSAMGDATDELLAKAKQVAPEPDGRELDMLLSVGERISMALLAMAIRSAGLEAVSLTGSQSGIITTASHTSARIMEVRPFRVQDALHAGRVVIVAGYQGVSYRRDITTLGRGGSDTTAVALAAALDAEACEIYSDVPGVLSADPRVVPAARVLPTLGYEEMQELAEAGARVLNAQAVEFAKRQGIALYAKKTGSAAPGTVVRTNAPTPSSGVRGVAHERAMTRIEAAQASVDAVRDTLSALGELGVQARQVSLSSTGFSCVLGHDDLHQPERARRIVEDRLGAVAWIEGCGAVALIGEGINRDGRVLEAALGALSALGVPVAGIATSSFRVSLLVPTAQVEASARALHSAAGLDAPTVAVTEA